jgi:hypothetical protein
MEILIFKGRMARRFYKSLDDKGLREKISITSGLPNTPQYV